MNTLARICFPLLIISLLLSASPLHAQKPVLVLGMHDAPPYLSVNPAGGSVVNLVREFAHHEGLKLEFRTAPYCKLLSMLARGKIDILAPVAFTQERGKKMLFSNRAFLPACVHTTIVPDSSSARTLSDLSGEKTGIVTGFSFYGNLTDMYKGQLTNFDFTVCRDFRQLVNYVAQKKLSAGIISHSSLLNPANQAGQHGRVRILHQSAMPVNLYFAVNPRKNILLAKLNLFLKKTENFPENMQNSNLQPPTSKSGLYNLLQKKDSMLYLIFFFFICIVALINFLIVRRTKQKNHQIQNSNIYLHDLLSIMPAGIAILDKELRILQVNREFLRMFEFDSQNVAGVHIDSLVISPQHRSGTRKFTLHTSHGKRIISEAVRLSGTQRELSVQIISTPIKINQSISGYIRIYMDLTEKIELEKEIANLKNNESLSVMAAGIAHDFNNLLTVIMGNLSLARDAESRDSLLKLLYNAEKAAHRSRALTGQLIAFSKGGSYQPEMVDVPSLIKDILSISAQQKYPVKSLLETTGRIPLVCADPSQLSQVFSNLIINAEQAMGDAGGILRITINTMCLEKNAEFLCPGKYVTIAFADSGSGISSENLGKIFTPYFSTKKCGNGLGLAVSYSIVKRHKGIIRVKSRPGCGSVFTVCLPAAH